MVPKITKIINLKVQIATSLHTRLAVAAAKRKISLRQFVTEAIEDTLKHGPREAA